MVLDGVLCVMTVIRNRLIRSELSVTNVLLFEHQRKKRQFADSFRFYGLTSYGSAWRKDVVYLCLEFD